MKSYNDLIVWKKSVELSAEIYKIVKLLPKCETYCLSDQMRRAAISVPSNIAEGQARKNTKEFIQFLRISKGSVAELETQMYVGCQISYFSEQQVENAFKLCAEVNKMLSTIITRLENKQ